MSDTFPVIDLRDAERGPAARADFLHRLRRAVHDIGFFQLVGHRVTGAAELLELSRKFFALPDEERRALDILDSPHFRGYSELGRERTRGYRTSGSSSTSAPSGPPPPRGRASPPTAGWSAPTSGRRACRPCGPPSWTGWTG